MCDTKLSGQIPEYLWVNKVRQGGRERKREEEVRYGGVSGKGETMKERVWDLRGKAIKERRDNRNQDQMTNSINAQAEAGSHTPRRAVHHGDTAHTDSAR